MTRDGATHDGNPGMSTKSQKLRTRMTQATAMVTFCTTRKVRAAVNLRVRSIQPPTPGARAITVTPITNPKMAANWRLLGSSLVRNTPTPVAKTVLNFNCYAFMIKFALPKFHNLSPQFDRALET